MSDKINEFTDFVICKNKPYPLGVYAINNSVYFAIEIKTITDCGLLLKNKISGIELKIPFSQARKTGNIYSGKVTGLLAEQYSYCLYEGSLRKPDYYSKRLEQPRIWGEVEQEAPLMSLLAESSYDWEEDKPLGTPYNESIFYMLHVRGFTQHISSKVKHKGTFAGLMEKSSYIKDLGVTALVLQPCYEFAEVEQKNNQKGTTQINYWGYKEGFYFVPKSAYTAGGNPNDEFKDMVKCFHRQGIEIILQFYFPKHITPIFQMEVLRNWVEEYHVDGFHLLGDHIVTELFAGDPFLADTKLWHSYWNTEDMCEDATKHLGVYQDHFLYVSRKFLKSDDHMLWDFLQQQRENSSLVGTINYLSGYNGFSIADMVSYDKKHNQENGEANKDGTDYNASWNCGVEGKTRRKQIVHLRKKQIRNALVYLLLAQGSPCFVAGDEFARTQEGNNNPYCQDNAITWVNWNLLSQNEEIYRFCKQMIELRKEYAILHPDQECKLMDTLRCGYPDLSYHGKEAWRPDSSGNDRHIGVMYCGKYAGEEEYFLYLAYNAHWISHKLALPKLPKKMQWFLCADTSGKGFLEELLPIANAQQLEIEVKERSVQIYIGKRIERL